MGPLLFSLAIRPLLERLSTFLGTDYLVLAYLDDVCVLSPPQELTTNLERIYSFFDTSPSSLNSTRPSASRGHYQTSRSTAVTSSSSCVGSPQSQATFLASKIDKLLEQVQDLASLPHQHALLLLRQCIQQDLHHLQGSLPDHPLITAKWTRLDQALWNEVRRLRGRVNQRQGDRQELEDAILSDRMRSPRFLHCHLRLPGPLLAITPSLTTSLAPLKPFLHLFVLLDRLRDFQRTHPLIGR